MGDAEQERRQRHIAAFRYHRGHQACTVEGCTGSHPLMWVPVAGEAGELAADEAEVIVLSALVQDALEAAAHRQGHPSPLDHIHWAS